MTNRMLHPRPLPTRRQEFHTRALEVPICSTPNIEAEQRASSKVDDHLTARGERQMLHCFRIWVGLVIHVVQYTSLFRFKFKGRVVPSRVLSQMASQCN